MIYNRIVYMKNSDSRGYLLGFNYLIFKKKYLKQKNI